MLRTRFACVPSLRVAAAAVVAVPHALAPLRRFEYPAVGMSFRSPDHARGEQLNSTYEKTTVAQRDAQAAYLTGSPDSVAYDAETMYNPEADVHKLARKYAAFRGHTKYVLDPVADKQISTAVELFEKADKDAVWAAVLKDYPSLKTPLDDATRAKIMGLFAKGIPQVMDDKAVAEMCAPVVRELLETKQIHYPLWWRFQEKLAEAMIANGQGSYHSRSVNLVTERFMKTLLNTWNDLPWASEEYVSPIYTDVCGTRQCTEAGMW